jgi:hypothetical protein
MVIYLSSVIYLHNRAIHKVPKIEGFSLIFGQNRGGEAR